MTLNDYRDQFRANMMVMSRTANGRLDMSASAAKADAMAVSGADEARDLALENTDRAVAYLYERRRQNFRSAGELEALVLECAEITLRGIVREGCLFRSGADSDKYNYARIADLPAMWGWFISDFFWLLTNQSFEPEEIAAFCEYAINTVCHFFSDGCGKISMLVSSFVFMRYDLPLPEYTSREEYYRAADRAQIPAAGDLNRLCGDAEFWRFVAYYMTLCRGGGPGFRSFMEQTGPDTYVCCLTGRLTGARSGVFRENILRFYESSGDILVVFDCATLAWIDREGIGALRDLASSGRRFALKNLSADCMVLVRVEGLEAHADGEDRLPRIDLSGCEKLNEGANGVIYKVSEEVVAKTFKNEPDYYDIVRQRIALKNALLCGVPAPFTFGYAVYDGRIVTLMELLRSRSLMQIIAAHEDADEYIDRYARFVRQLHQVRDPGKLNKFTRDMFGREILGKAERCDRVLPEPYRGRAGKIIEAADGPECLVHGDIQPNNIMFSGDEMLFIDFDSFSTGRAVYDLGSLYRTLLCGPDAGVSDVNSFLRISYDRCRKIWDRFVREYYQGEPEETIREKTAQAALIGTVLALAKFIKNGEEDAIIAKWAGELISKIEAAEQPGPAAPKA